MSHEFYALLGRMRYITRWGLMRNSFSENIQEHSHQVAVLAHALALIRRDILKLDGPDPDRCAVAAMYHDATETLTGDLPTPIKYYNSDIKDAYKQVEHIAGQRLLSLLPQELRSSYEPLILESDETVNPIVKAADKLSAYIKCDAQQLFREYSGAQPSGGGACPCSGADSPGYFKAGRPGSGPLRCGGYVPRCHGNPYRRPAYPH